MTLVSTSQAIALGQKSAENVTQAVGLVDNKTLQQYVARIGHELASNTVRPDLPWAFHVADIPTPNAFALPGGYIFVTRGMMGLMMSEAQLASVLGHEIGHVTARHAVVQMSRKRLARIGLGLGMVLSPELAQFGQLANQGLHLLFLKYSRDDERQADKLGFKYMVNAGYDPHEMTDVFEALDQSSELAGSSPLPGWLASHPSGPERIQAVKQRIAALPPAEQHGTTGRKQYLSHINGLVYGTNPRQGFFQGNWFYHPELSFRFRVPADWQRQNLSHAVEAVSPKKDAVVRLTISPKSTPDAAARAFVAQPSVTALASQTMELDGNPTVLIAFGATSGNGTLNGYASFVTHGQSVYRILAFSPTGVFPGYRDQLRQIATSFSGTDDPDILGVQPQRIEIVKLPSTMSFTQFTQRYPSTVNTDVLALINQIDNPSQSIPGGTLLKRVTGGINQF